MYFNIICYILLFSCNPMGPKRTWQQLNIKHKNIVQTGKTFCLYLISCNIRLIELLTC